MKAMTEQASLNGNVVGERTECSDFNGILLPISCHAPTEEPENQAWMMIQTYVDCGELFLTYPGNRVCHRNSPPLYTAHTHVMAGGVCCTDGCPDLWTNTISHKQLCFFWPLDRESVCNPTIYSSAKCLIWSIINSVSENSHGLMLPGVRSN